MVQGVLGRKHAEALLMRLGLLGAHSSMESSFPKVGKNHFCGETAEEGGGVIWDPHMGF